MTQQHDDTSKALLEAARRLLLEEGPEALTVRKIATAADMSTMNVYSRFDGKNGVIDELYVDGFNRLIAMLACVADDGDAATQLVGLAREYRAFALENPAYYSIMFGTAVRDYDASPRAIQNALGALDLIAERVTSAQQSGQLVAGDGHDAVTVSAMLWATCHGLVSLEMAALGAEAVNWESAFELGIVTAVAGLRTSISVD